MVLLKNEDEILPLKPDRLKTIAVIGPNADSQRNLLGSYSYASLNKHFGDGGHGDTFEECFGRKVVTVLEGLQDKLDGKMTLKYACGCDILSDSVEDFQEAVKVAAESDAAIIVVGDRSGMFMDGSTGESVDRVSNRLYGVQEALVHAVAETGTPIILVLINGRPPYISPILGKVKAVLEAWLPGEEGGDAIAGVLAGDVNPGGKLTVSLLKDPGQHPLPYNLKKVNFHKEYLDCSMRPEFPFGHGLSYTTFAYSDLEIHVEESSGYVEASFLLTNSGKREGDEVVQLYIQDVIASIARPVMELKGFKRISLKPAECKKVTFRLYIEQLAFHNREMKLVVEPGEFRLMIGSSSADIRLEGSFCLGGENREIGAERRFFSEVDFE